MDSPVTTGAVLPQPALVHGESAIAPRPYLLVSADFVRTGGMDLSNYHLADLLARREVPVHIVSHHVDPALLNYPNVTWHKAARPLGSNLIGELMLRHRGRSLARERVFADAVVVVNGGNCPLPAVNWVHYVHAASPRIESAGLIRKCKNTLTRRLFKRDEARAFRKARMLIANSRLTKDDLIRHYGLPESRIHLIYYGVDPARFYPVTDSEKRTQRIALGLPCDKFLFAFVGALGDRRKGFDILFEAWKACGEDFRRSSELVVIGRGAELPLWERRAAQLPHGGSIRFLGFRNDVPDVLRACDVLVAPTRYEAFGLAVLEALCCSLPAIVSRSAGVAEKYPAELDSLLLSNPESIAELAAKLHFVRQQHEVLKPRLRWLSLDLRSYTWDDMATLICRAVDAP